MKRVRYNWKARLQSRGNGEGHTKKKAFRVELDESLFDGSCTNCEYPLDTNAQVLPSKKAKLNEDSDNHPAKRKKLSAKQRKRLLKVVEAKEKKAKVRYSNCSAPHVPRDNTPIHLFSMLSYWRACLHSLSHLPTCPCSNPQSLWVRQRKPRARY